MRTFAPTLTLAAILLAVSCAQAPAGTQPTASPAAPEPAATTPAPVTPPPTPTAEPVAGAECEPGLAPEAPAGWLQLNARGGEFTLAYPADWEDLGGLVNFEIGSMLDEATVAEAGLDPSGRMQADFVRDPAGFPNLSVFRFDGVHAPTAIFRQRQIERFQGLPEVSQVHTTLPDVCLDGVTASGLELFFDPGDGSLLYQQSLFAVRDGVAHHIQWLDEDDRSVPQVLGHMLNSWRWSDAPSGVDPTPADGVGGAIQTVGMALEPPATGEAVDPSTFRTTFAPTAPRIYLVYELTPGTVTTVTFEWYQLGEFIFDDTFNWTATTTWGWASMGPPPGGLGFQPGDYRVVMTLDSGESRTLDFVIQGP